MRSLCDCHLNLLIRLFSFRKLQTSSNFHSFNIILLYKTIWRFIIYNTIWEKPMFNMYLYVILAFISNVCIKLPYLLLRFISISHSFILIWYNQQYYKKLIMKEFFVFFYRQICELFSKLFMKLKWFSNRPHFY